MDSHEYTSLSDSMAELFGADGSVAPAAVATLYRALGKADVPAEWAELFGFSGSLTKRQQRRMRALASGIDERPDRARFFFAIHTYHALVLWLTLRRAVLVEAAEDASEIDRTLLEALASGRWFRERLGIDNLGDDGFGWCVERDGVVEASLAVDAALAAVDEAAFRAAFGAYEDVFKALYEATIPRTVRKSLGEHYTPDWLAEHLVGQLEEACAGRLGRALDPSCGSGTFLLEVLRRRAADGGATLPQLFDAVTGYDLNPLAVLAARVNLVLATLTEALECGELIGVPVFRQDALEAEPKKTFDAIVGNPPWINWQGLTEARRDELQHLWERYGLFVHEGFDTILGKGKKEFATLFTAAVIDRYLADGGRIAFVITQGVWKAAGASEGFRALDFGGQFELAVEQVEDLSAFKVFDSATTRTTTFVAKKGARTRFPVPYVYWRREGRRARLDSRGRIDDALEHAERIELAAEPYDADAPQSPWITARPAAIRALRRVFGESAYQARQGVNTGGGNAIFWMRVLQRTTLGGARVENILKGAKKKVEQVQAEIESRYLYPLVRGRDVSRWHAEGDRHILMVQDPERRRGVDEDVLREQAPRTLAYLERFEDQLRSRSLFRRYFMRSGEPVAPWWSMFGVGEYTLLPWKVVWAGQVATHLDCAVVGPSDGQLTLPDQTVYYVGLESEAQADFLCGLLNSSPVRLLYRSFLYKHVSLSFIEVLDLPAYDDTVAWMVQLAAAARDARLADNPAGAEARVDAIACEYWGIDEAQRGEIARSLQRLG